MIRKPLAVFLELMLAIAVYLVVAAAMTWPAIRHMDEVVIGGGELGGWLWRQWWHFQEVDALGSSETLGVLERLQALVGLGRFPETGNILDILLLDYPLERVLGFPWHHNLKVLVILVGNGLCGYALARTQTTSTIVALTAGTVAVINPLVIQDVNKTGLRQVLLWWLLLYPVVLERAGRTGRMRDGVMVGAMFAMTSAFYWFYGVFAVMYTGIWAVSWWFRRRLQPWAALRWMSAAVVTASIGLGLFLMPYFSAGKDAGGQGGVSRLPELTFLLSFPAYDTVADAPLRPTTYRENLLASLHRTIDSGWPADYVFNPFHGVEAFPLVVFVFGVIPALFLKRGRLWLVVWTVFWLGTIGPFLKLGSGRDTSEVIMLGDFVVRMPYVWMFQLVPGMSRMFAPYRMASMVVVASVILLSIGLDSMGRRNQIWVAPLAGIAVVLQPFWRFDLGPVAEGVRGPEMWRVPTVVSAMRIPSWYEDLSPDGWEGIIELPLEQQQDLICTYQSLHQQKLYRSWATAPAIPPLFRRAGGGEYGERLRWLASPEPRNDGTEDVFRSLSRGGAEVDLAELKDGDLAEVIELGRYRWMVVHERGYYLLDPRKGSILYRDVVRRLSERLGLSGKEHSEQSAFDWPGRRRSFPLGPAWIPWASQEVPLPTEQMPTRYFMTVFDLDDWRPVRGSEDTSGGSEPLDDPLDTEAPSMP